MQYGDNIMNRYLILADGSSVHTLKWIKELSRYFDIYIISFNSISQEIEDIVGKKNSFCFLSNLNVSGGNANILRYVFCVARLIKQINPHYINAHYITSYGTMAVLASGICGYSGKIISSTWGSDVLVTPWQNKLYYYLTKYVLKKSDIITSDSQYMTAKINDIYAKANVMTFPFGIENYPEISIEEKNKKYVFSNRGLEPNYNIDLVIKIFASLYRDGYVEKLYMAHDGSERKNLQKLVKDLGLSSVVEFLGFMSLQNQKEYYKKCGLYISVPTSDSTSVSLLEAMAYGCVPIVSNIPANSEWVTDMKNGLIINNLNDINIEGFDFEEAFKINRRKIAQEAIWRKTVEDYIDKIKTM